MFYTMIVIFIVGYICIALEHVIHVNKSATALFLAAVMWVCLICGDPSTMVLFPDFQAYLQTSPDTTFLTWLSHHSLLDSLGETAEILFFLMGAMTIVEQIDSHGGFKLVTDKITTTRKITLMWIICVLSFFMSAALDNMTTTIVMVALLRKIIDDKQDRWLFAGMVVLAANAGGAWSPIGDVTTIMLWVAGKVSSFNIIKMTLLASAVSIVAPLIILSFTLKGNVSKPRHIGGESGHHQVQIPQWQSQFVFFLGVSLLLFVPIFKTITHLPPYLGMIGGLGIMWIVTDIMNRKHEDRKHYNSITAMLQRIDTPSILFFLGILMAVAALQSYGHLSLLARSLDTIPMDEPNKYYLITVIIGVLSSIVDNVPLVAAAIGMYHFPIDHYFWEFLAYTAGTGGSILIIGSAAGVAAMGMEKIDFIWYMKRISWLALIGYLAGCAVFILQKNLMSM